MRCSHTDKTAVTICELLASVLQNLIYLCQVSEVLGSAIRSRWGDGRVNVSVIWLHHQVPCHPLTNTISVSQDGFSRGLSIGNDDFSLDDLDPLKN